MAYWTPPTNPLIKPQAPSQEQLLGGVTRTSSGGSTPSYQYWYGGNAYDNSAQANAAAQQGQIDATTKSGQVNTGLYPTYMTGGSKGYGDGGGSIAGLSSGGGSVNIGGGTYPVGGPLSIPGGASIVQSSGTGGGNINLSRDAYEAQQMAQLRARLAQQFLGGIGMGAVNPGAQVQYGGGQFDAARDAAFARAKEQAGQTAQSAVKGLQGLMAQRGLRGSTIEGGALGDILRGGMGAVNDFTREQLIQDLAQQQHVADTTYQGGITQRGQNIEAQRALMSLFGNIY